MIHSTTERTDWRLYFAPGVWTYATPPNRLVRWLHQFIGLRWERA